MATLKADRVKVVEHPEAVSLIFRCDGRADAAALYESLKAELDAGGLALKLETDPKN